VGTKIKKVEYFLPNNRLTNEDLKQDFPDADFESFEEKVGIKSRYIVSGNQTAVDLAVGAGEKVLNGYERSKIDFVILCTQSPDYFLPTSACILQDRLGLSKNIGAYDFNLGCSGYIYGLAMAKGLISSNIATNILLLTAETYSKYIHRKDRTNRLIFGDAATATIIEKDNTQNIGEFVLKTDGGGANCLIVKNGAAKNFYNFNAPEIEYGTGNITTENNLFMNGPEIFNFTIENIPLTVSEAIDKNETELEKIDFFIFHQANKFMLDFLRKKCKISKDKFYVDLSETGNTVSSTIPIALSKLLHENKLKEGDKVMLVGFGVGLSWGATIITI
jgi:3-oxoacyl-[acyl-carrier-protein] synthase-3